MTRPRPPRVVVDQQARPHWLREDGALLRDDGAGWTLLGTFPDARGLAPARTGCFVIAPPGLRLVGADGGEAVVHAVDVDELAGAALLGGVPHLGTAAGIVVPGASPRVLPPAGVVALAARPDGRALYLALAGGDGAVVELALPGGEATPVAHLGAPVDALAHSPGGLAAVAGGALHGVNVRHRVSVLIRPLPEALAGASLAADHKGELTLATARAIYRCFGDGTGMTARTP